MTTKQTKAKAKAGSKVAIASAKELQQKALSALAGSNRAAKGKTEKAIWFLGSVQVPLLALEEIGQKLPKLAMSSFAIRQSVEGIGNTIRAAYAEAAKHIPAIQRIMVGSLLNKSCAALDALDAAMALVDESEHGDKESLPKPVRDVTARFIIGLTAEAGRWMEQASEALGENAIYGWLEGHGVDGLPSDLMRGDVQQQLMAREFGKLDPEQREKVALVVTNLAKVG